MAGYRFHFSIREFYFVDFDAESLEDAREQLEYCGLHFQNYENGNYLEDRCVACEDEDYRDDDQWEKIPVEDIMYPR